MSLDRFTHYSQILPSALAHAFQIGLNGGGVLMVLSVIARCADLQTLEADVSRKRIQRITGLKKSGFYTAVGRLLASGLVSQTEDGWVLNITPLEMRSITGSSKLKFEPAPAEDSANADDESANSDGGQDSAIADSESANSDSYSPQTRTMSPQTRNGDEGDDDSANADNSVRKNGHPLYISRSSYQDPPVTPPVEGVALELAPMPLDEVDRLIASANARLAKSGVPGKRIGRLIAEELGALGIGRSLASGPRKGQVVGWDRTAVMRRLRGSIVADDVSEIIAYWHQIRVEAGLDEDQSASSDGARAVQTLMMARSDTPQVRATAVAGIKRALSNLLKDDWHRSAGLTTLAWACKSASNVQKLRDMRPAATRSRGRSSAPQLGMGGANIAHDPAEERPPQDPSTYQDFSRLFDEAEEAARNS